jgi:hypothetical protein
LNRSAFGGPAYHTTGVLVPLHVFEAAAKHCFLIDPDPPDEPLPSDAETDAA